jgi:type IV pilus assembly protein PilA
MLKGQTGLANSRYLVQIGLVDSMCRVSYGLLPSLAKPLHLVRPYPCQGVLKRIYDLIQGEKMSKREKGFSLIELLIVVAIILIIAAIAIPNLLRARIAANEASAVGSVRTVVTSEVTYSSTWGTGFSTTLVRLGGALPCTAAAATACLIDPVLGAGAKSGYNFAAPGGAVVNGITTTFAVGAVPQTIGTTGQRSFCSDESGVVRFDPTGATNAATDTACQVLTALQ